jgi:glycosyltransferase involved in cell wall biosynthesis
VVVKKEEPRQPNGKLRVICLGFQEVTADARVMKEARALARIGHDVQVFCDWPSGHSAEDYIQGVRINRFRCFDFAEVDVEFVKTLDFLKQSFPEVSKRYFPFAGACIKFRFLGEIYGLDYAKLPKWHYKRFKGAERLKKKLDHLFERLKLRTAYFRRPSLCPNAYEMLGDDDLQKLFREADQCLAILFAENLFRGFPEIVADVIHAHDIYTLVAGVVLAQKCGAKLIYDAHEYEPGRFAIDEKSPDSLLPTLIEDDAFQFVDAIITVSDSIAERYKARLKRQCVVIANVPESGFGSAASNDYEVSRLSIRKTIGLDANTPLFVFTGLVQQENRGLDKVVMALSYLPSFHFAVLGPRNTVDDAWLLSVAKSQGVANRVHFLPAVDARDVPLAIASCDLAVVPIQPTTMSHRLAMPTKLFEAAFSGIPLCVSDLPEMRRFVEVFGIGRVMDQSNPEKIAQAVREVFENRQNYSLTEQSRNRLRQEYGWGAQSHKLAKLYEDLAQPQNYVSPVH